MCFVFALKLCCSHFRTVSYCLSPVLQKSCLFCGSADAGWDDLKGYDMSTGESNVLTKFVGGANEIFVVQVREGVT